MSEIRTPWDAPQEKNAVAPVAKQNDALQILGPKLAMVTSLDLSSNEGKRLFCLAKDGEPMKIADALDKPFQVQDLLMHECVEQDEDTGEEKTWTRFVLIGVDGSMLAGGGDGVVGSIRTLYALYGSPKWEPPITVIPRRVAGQKGHFRHFLEIV